MGDVKERNGHIELTRACPETETREFCDVPRPSNFEHPLSAYSVEKLVSRERTENLEALQPVEIDRRPGGAAPIDDIRCEALCVGPGAGRGNIVEPMLMRLEKCPQPI